MARTNDPRDTGSRAQNRERWRAHVLAQQRGHLNQREYCEAHDLTYASFARWRRLLLSSGTVRPSNDASAFVPVRVESDFAPTVLRNHNDGVLSLVLPSGIRITGITAATISTAAALAGAL